jgi:hypothetical protein
LKLALMGSCLSKQSNMKFLSFWILKYSSHIMPAWLLTYPDMISGQCPLTITHIPCPHDFPHMLTWCVTHCPRVTSLAWCMVFELLSAYLVLHDR